MSCRFPLTPRSTRRHRGCGSLSASSSAGSRSLARGWCTRRRLPPSVGCWGPGCRRAGPFWVPFCSSPVHTWWWPGRTPLGAAPRLWQRTRLADGLAFAFGLLLLVNSRPYEGVMVSVVPAIAVLVRRLRWRSEPAAVVVKGLVLHYNARVTGSPWRFPYQEYERQYSNVPLFSSAALGPRISYRHEMFRKYYEVYAEYTYSLTSLSPSRWRFKAWLLYVYLLRPFLGWWLLIPLAAGFVGIRGPTLIVASAVALVVFGNLAAAWIWPHYFAPAAGGLFVLVTRGLRQLRSVAFRGCRVGVILLPLVLAGAGAEAAAFWPVVADLVRASRTGWPARRVAIERGLSRRGGKHLVIVGYGPEHDVHEEWVYNRADIDAATVVWARGEPGSSSALLE